ncbi:MAG: hypothetical protein KatS3mg057_2666 [Herpetosiphonaceae bacterium]|nr:MAG: hypothetical protein KatS3mg057_2666 [Herpetosiphonaceae bacterium]
MSIGSLIPRRADFLLEADIAISLHQNSLESRYAAVRSRFLDHLWAGLPSIVSDGDSAAELVRTYDLGRVVTPQDHDQLARAMLDLLNDEDSRKQCAERAARLASTWQWEVVLAPLMWWVESAPTRKRNAMEKESAFTVSEKPEQQEVAEISIPSSLDSLIALAREAEQLWELFPGDSRKRIIASMCSDSFCRSKGECSDLSSTDAV